MSWPKETGSGTQVTGVGDPSVEVLLGTSARVVYAPRQQSDLHRPDLTATRGRPPPLGKRRAAAGAGRARGGAGRRPRRARRRPARAAPPTQVRAALAPDDEERMARFSTLLLPRERKRLRRVLRGGSQPVWTKAGASASPAAEHVRASRLRASERAPARLCGRAMTDAAARPPTPGPLCSRHRVSSVSSKLWAKLRVLV